MKLLVSLNRVFHTNKDADTVLEDNELSFPEGAEIRNLVSIRSSLHGDIFY
jgi:hypothetical protein